MDNFSIDIFYKFYLIHKKERKIEKQNLVTKKKHILKPNFHSISFVILIYLFKAKKKMFLLLLLLLFFSFFS